VINVSMLRRLSGPVLGIGATVVVIVILVAFSSFRDEEHRASDQSDPAAPTAQSDPPALRGEKNDLNSVVKQFVPAAFSRTPGTSHDAYLDRISPFVSTEFAADFESHFDTPPEQAIRDENITVTARSSDVDFFGHLEKDDEVLHFDGSVVIEFTKTQETDDPVTWEIEYQINLLREPDDVWRVTFCEPRI
jgi:hypothetical protein